MAARQGGKGGGVKVAKTIAKVPVLVGVCHGFVGNRMLAQRSRETQALVMEGALPWQVDKVLYDFGFPMGPFTLVDNLGFDVCRELRHAGVDGAHVAQHHDAAALHAGVGQQPCAARGERVFVKLY